MKRFALSAAVAAAFLSGPVLRADTFLLIVSGLGGDEGYSERFHDWSVSVLEAATEDGIPSDNVVYLAEDPGLDEERIQGESRKENVEAALRGLLGRAGVDDQIWIVLFGHGSERGGHTRFNLPGPDMTDADFAALLEGAPVKTVAFVNASSSSGSFVPTLSAAGRVIVTATRSGSERHAPTFGGFFSQAFTDGLADVDKDERVSLLEAFNYARVEVERDYRDSGRLPTEHALLDDNGDGEGSLEPTIGGADGSLASRLFFARGAEIDPDASPRTAALLAEKDDLEDRIASLRAQKDGLDEGLYLKELQTLLLALAENREAIDATQAEQPDED